ncbi:MAG: iron uptake porin, partial [Rivularia sp. ALOHA_DT_140]|nr:iron uptake porin [Rivularia sp. ALOHA_DT_140]
MKRNLLVCASGVSLLYLLAGFSNLKALAVEKNSNSQAISSSEKLLANKVLSQESFPRRFEQYAQPNKQINKNATIAQVTQNQQQTTSTRPVTSVSELSDVKPTDWAAQALQSLVERYGCIAGYPNGTYGGNRAMTRYEFAAGLNACLDRVKELIEVATASIVTKEDLTTLERLQQEFAPELATLRGRVDALEARSAELEASQFSTTTKLQGEAIFAAIGATGGAPDKDNPNIILTNRVRLNLNTSFTGKDLLITGLQAHNFGGGADG